MPGLATAVAVEAADQFAVEPGLEAVVAAEFQHDILDRLREIRNPRGEVYEYRYDRAGRLIEEISFD
ncbi:MAG: RHS repeat domain-containing protein, partial [Tepidisphaerales bacterium]